MVITRHMRIMKLKEINLACYSSLNCEKQFPPPEKYNCFKDMLPTKNELREATKMLLTIAKYNPGLLPGHGPSTADPRPISFAFRP